MIREIGRAVREAIRVALALPANSVIPANQASPTRGATYEFVKVQLMSVTDDGTPSLIVEDIGPDTTVEHSDVLKVVIASVNFYKGTTEDAAGISSDQMTAFDKAARIEQILRGSRMARALALLNLGFVGASPARDLTALVANAWESRGQVDLTFTVGHRVTEAAPTIGSMTIEMSASLNGGSTIDTRTILAEETTP